MKTKYATTNIISNYSDAIKDDYSELKDRFDFYNVVYYKNFKYQKEISDKHEKYIELLCKEIDDIEDKNIETDEIIDKIISQIDTSNKIHQDTTTVLYLHKNKINKLKIYNVILFGLLSLVLILFISSNILLSKRINKLENNIDYIKTKYINNIDYEDDITGLNNNIQDIKIKTGSNEAKINNMSSILDQYMKQYPIITEEEDTEIN